MPAQTGLTPIETMRSVERVHVIGAGPAGLLLTALLQSIEGLSVCLYEKRSDYTRTRMVHLQSYLVADSAESYREDRLDGEIDQADPEYGFYSPYSWWPLILGFACFMVALGVVFANWLFAFGALAVLFAVSGWLLEYYLGAHAH